MGKKIFKNLDPSFVNKLSNIVGHKSKTKDAKKSTTTGTKVFKHSITTSNKPPTPPPLPPIKKIKEIKPIITKTSTNPIPEKISNEISSEKNKEVFDKQEKIIVKRDNIDGMVFVKMMKQHVKMSGIILKHEENKIDKLLTMFIICFMMNIFMYLFFKII